MAPGPSAFSRPLLRGPVRVRYPVNVVAQREPQLRGIYASLGHLPDSSRGRLPLTRSGTGAGRCACTSRRTSTRRMRPALVLGGEHDYHTTAEARYRRPASDGPLKRWTPLAAMNEPFTFPPDRQLPGARHHGLDTRTEQTQTRGSQAL